MAVDERDKGTGGEVNLAQSKYELALSDYTDWLLNQQVGDNLEVEGVMLG